MRTMTKLELIAFLLLIGQMVHAQAIGTVTYEYTDRQGTPLAEADSNRNITASFDYTPYGSIALGSTPNGTGYTGHINDPETGLIYMQARYYDPTVGGFLSVDPSQPVGGNLFGFGRYGYAGDNPIVNTDPTGRYTCPIGGSFCTLVDQMVVAYDHAADVAPDPKERALLMAGAAYIGRKGDGRGPVYVPGSLPLTGLARSDQIQTTTVDTKKLSLNADGTLTKLSLVDGAAAVGHEAKHDLWAQHKGHRAANPDEYTSTETQAYEVTNAVYHSYGRSMTREELQRSIKASVKQDIDDNQHPSQQPAPVDSNPPPNVINSNNGAPNNG